MTAAEATVAHKDVVIALLGASAGLSGLVLVFLGLVMGSIASFSPGTKPAIVARARRPAIWILVSFGVGVACVAVATAWLVHPHGAHLLYVATVSLFAAQLVTLVAATGFTAKRTVWG